jgi:hypothetical protein
MKSRKQAREVARTAEFIRRAGAWKFGLGLILLITATAAGAQSLPDKATDLVDPAPWVITDVIELGPTVYERMISGDGLAYRSYFTRIGGQVLEEPRVGMLYAVIGDTFYVMHDGTNRWKIPAQSYLNYVETRDAYDDLEALQVLFGHVFTFDSVSTIPRNERCENRTHPHLPCGCDIWTGSDCCRPSDTINPISGQRCD